MIASVNHEIVIEDNVIGAVDNNLDNASNLHYNPKWIFNSIDISKSSSLSIR